jgi:hypothetical protein
MRRHRSSSDDRSFDLDDYAPPPVMRMYVKAIGITILLGLVTGLLWIGWRLFDLHVLL